MITGTDTVLISLRQADGEYYPLFHRGDPDTRNITLEPASDSQAEAEIQFFYHPENNDRPEKMGSLRFADLPIDGDRRELQLDAIIGSTGLFTVTVRHAESGRVERLEMELPDESNPASPSGRGSWQKRPVRWLAGILFFLLSLAVIAALTWFVTDWGREEAIPPPVSRALTGERT